MSTDSEVSITDDAILAARPSPAIEWVDVEGEIVAWNEERESLHLLDPVAGIIFQLCDGVTPLRVTLEEVAAAFGREPTEIAADVRECAVSLTDLGLVERVG